MRAGEPFFNLYSHGFVRVAAATPHVQVADPDFNAAQTLDLMRQAWQRQAVLVLFPELGLSAYSCEDLFHQRALLDGCVRALERVVRESAAWPIIGVVGLPLEVDGMLFNCAAVVHRGRIRGVVPKTYLPNYREFYEARHFVPACRALRDRIDLLGQNDIPFGTRLLFEHAEQPALRFHVEICEDLWVPIAPSSYAALAGATVLLNLSASNVTIGKSEFRHQLAANQSARCLAAYLYSAAGIGESTTDLAWDGQSLIYENGTLVAESQRFAYEAQLTVGEIDLDRLVQDRLRQSSFAAAGADHRQVLGEFRTIEVSEALPADDDLLLERALERFPYVPSDPADRDRRCREVYEIQVQGLASRLRATGIEKVVIGISGGLDSTQALLVAIHTMDVLGYPRSNVLAYSMPGFATGEATRAQAHELMEAVGCRAGEIDIRPSAMQMLEDIGHPYARGERGDEVYDVTFENVQAGERTSHLFRLANLNGGLVVGTSDLSELALGWCTYGVGDHMAHYHLNASVPKTLVQYLVRWVADTGQLGAKTSAVLRRVLETEISPELVPGENAEAIQRSEAVVGPYELQDFNLYYTLRFGYPPSKVAFLAYCAWRDVESGGWPEVPPDRRNRYGIAEIRHWLEVFLQRFFEDSQYKRSCIANAPKVGSGGSLSPRGDWRAPSDGQAAAWLADLALVPERG